MLHERIRLKNLKTLLWVDSDLRIDTKKTRVSVENGLHSKNMLTILVSIINIIGETNLTTSSISTRIFIFSINKKLI